jgi:hypothetical protein
VKNAKKDDFRFKTHANVHQKENILEILVLTIIHLNVAKVVCTMIKFARLNVNVAGKEQRPAILVDLLNVNHVNRENIKIKIAKLNAKNANLEQQVMNMV